MQGINRPAKDVERKNWDRIYARKLVILDFLVIALTIALVQLFQLGESAEVTSRNPLIGDTFSYWLFGTFLSIAWVEAIALSGGYDLRVAGVGTEEARRIVTSSVMLFGIIAIFAFLLRIDLSRGLLLIALPVGIVALSFERWFCRRWLWNQREQGNFNTDVLLVGSGESLASMVKILNEMPSCGYRPIGVCLTSASDEDLEFNLPTYVGTGVISSAISDTNAGAILVTNADDLQSSLVQQLSWDLEPDQQLLFSANITGIAGPRIHAHTVSGLPLVSVATPRLTEPQKFTKRVFDIVGSLILILLLSPVMIAVAIAVKFSSRGPVLFSHERIGQAGKPFRMHKFRSMREGADSELAELLEQQESDNTPLFKIENDPRITSVGRFIRKYSLDEFPQFFNVLWGSMSLVGPRPQVEGEVALYTDNAHRRLMLRPGCTGLWQVSGRSALEWEQAILLDLYYVENWSLASDIAILAKTVKAVVLPGETAH